jgi:hypothetical protein
LTMTCDVMSSTKEHPNPPLIFGLPFASQYHSCENIR